MSWTRETLIQKYLESSLNSEGQREFDRLFRDDPSFSDAVTQAMEKILSSNDEISPAAVPVTAPAAKKRQTMNLSWARKSNPWIGWGLLAATGVVAILLLVQTVGQLVKAHGVRFHRQAIDPDSPAALKALAALPPASSADALKTAGTLNGDGVESLSPSVQALLTPDAREDSIGVPPGERSPDNGDDLWFREGSKIYLSTESDKIQTVGVYVLGSGGTLVRRIFEGVWKKGPHQIVWDGMDDAGRQAPPGPYAVVLKTNEKTLSDQVLILPLP
jgi:hypothetical protein